MTAPILLLQASSTSSTGGIMSFLPLILIFVVFYFFMIRPQSKKQKAVQKAREALKNGDTVVTSGGIVGKIKDVKEDNFIVEIADNVRVKVEKNSVFAVEKIEEKKK